MTGRAWSLPVDLHLQPFEQFSSASASLDALQVELNRLNTAADTAQEQYASSREAQLMKKPAKRSAIQPGDLVWLFAGDKQKTVTGKALPPWNGPHFVEAVLSPANLYVNCKVVNARRIKRTVGVSLQQVIFQAMTTSLFERCKAAFNKSSALYSDRLALSHVQFDSGFHKRVAEFVTAQFPDAIGLDLSASCSKWHELSKIECLLADRDIKLAVSAK
jgi:hypothetical protein